MTEHRDDLGDDLQLAERARETDYFRKLDQDLMAKLRQQAEQEIQAGGAPGTLCRVNRKSDDRI